MPDQDLIKTAEGAVSAFNEKDWERFRSLMTADSVYDEKGTQRRVQGADEIIELTRGWAQAFPDARGTVTNALAGGSTVVLEITWEGAQTGSLVTPGGEIPATGKRVTIPAVQVLRFQDDKIAENRHYFDMMTMMQQLGVVPSPAQAARQ